jgi:hypothetical protein
VSGTNFLENKGVSGREKLGRGFAGFDLNEKSALSRSFVVVGLSRRSAKPEIIMQFQIHLRSLGFSANERAKECGLTAVKIEAVSGASFLAIENDGDFSVAGLLVLSTIGECPRFVRSLRSLSAVVKRGEIDSYFCLRLSYSSASFRFC